MEAYIAGAVRTPVGKRGGALKDIHPAALLAHTLRVLLQQSGLEAGAVDDVIAGCVSQVGEQSLNIARNALLHAGFPVHVPGTTVDRQCGSSQQALAFAAQGVASGAYDCAIACGVESMTRVPLGSSFQNGPGSPLARIYNQGISAELIAQRWHLTREALDAFSLESHRRAATAWNGGAFASHAAAIPELTKDEGVRADTSLEKLASLKPAFREDGTVTAGNASQISDGAAAVLLVSERFANEHRVPLLARIVANAVVGDDPELMLTAVMPATKMVLQRAGLKLEQIDLFEVNEAFASVVLAWQAETGVDLARVNVNGGAIAIGHPLGASGARLMADLVHELQRRRARYGLQVMCEGGGMANATIIERIE